MKQSSIEFLLDKFGSIIGDMNTTNEQDLMLMEVIKQAKLMHKEEIVDANFFGQRLHAKSVTNTMMEDNAYGYYNETFNTEEK
jgi:hypothetical protein